MKWLPVMGVPSSEQRATKKMRSRVHKEKQKGHSRLVSLYRHHFTGWKKRLFKCSLLVPLVLGMLALLCVLIVWSGRDVNSDPKCNSNIHQV